MVSIPKAVRPTIGWVFLGAGVLWLGLWATEWWRIAIVGRDAVVAEYHFGSDSMVGHGGWAYANPQVYGWSVLAFGAVGFAMTWLLRAAILRRSWLRVGLAGLLCISWWVATAALEHVDWKRHDGPPGNQRAG